MIDLPLPANHRLTQAKVCVHDHLTQTAIHRVDAESNSRYVALGHLLNYYRHGREGVVEALLMTISDGTIEPQRKEAVPNSFQNNFFPDAVQIRLMLAREGGACQVLHGGRGTDGKRLPCLETGEVLSDFRDGLSWQRQLRQAGAELFTLLAQAARNRAERAQRPEPDSKPGPPGKAPKPMKFHHFNRSLGQITGDQLPYEPFRCPELYYLREGKYISNPHVPLLWTQANLTLCFQMLEKSSAMLAPQFA